MSLVVISSDNYPGFSKRGAEFPRVKGIPNSNLRWLFFDLGAARSTMLWPYKRGIVYMQSSFEKNPDNFVFCRVLKVNVLLSVSIKRGIVHMQSSFEKVPNNFFFSVEY